MIRREKGEFVAECTECGCEEYGGCEEAFARFVDQLKRLGWKVQKDPSDGEWMHFCPECRA